MGWSGATELFDGCVDAALEMMVEVTGRATRPDIQHIVRLMYRPFAHSDWDTEDESEYFEPYLKNVLIELGRIDD